MVKCLVITIIFLCSCAHPIKKNPVKIVVDLKSKGGWMLKDGDSIWWQQPEFILDSTVSEISFGHSNPLDTIFGLKNMKPLVVIVDKDTTRYYFGDTIRYNSCNYNQLAYQ